MVEAEGADCYLLEADLRKGESVCKDLIQRTVDRYGSIDVLINNASEQHTTQKVEDLDSSVLESTFAVNVFAMLYLAKHAVPHMKRGAAIVNSASVVAYAGGGSLLEYTCVGRDLRFCGRVICRDLANLVYLAALFLCRSSKGAIVSLTRALSQQLAPRGIRVNAVAPGPVRGVEDTWHCLFWSARRDSNFFLSLLQIMTPLNPATRDQENLDNWYKRTPPLGRIGQVCACKCEDCAEGVFVHYEAYYVDLCIMQPSECGPSYIFLASSVGSTLSDMLDSKPTDAPKMSTKMGTLNCVLNFPCRTRLI